ncbi:MAG TPA: FAD/NAD(P)-binding oxidoreductase [Candidatus Sulfopaludibacter sp.]|jgi:NADPH-dependent 2,4-dienoyl-CoA reductase/sulfur reductase-like enzyme|nr:FAD/NAD(P)-binding oxidoreductase [Candidatus Sulfopaludibacter sp.]
MADRFDVVVVGAGPAGLAAACRAAESGASVALIDDNPVAGGQIWRGGAGPAAPWIRKIEQHRVEWIAGARVFAVPETGRMALEHFEGNREIGYARLVLATGARERFLPFPGWTLPNVAGAGGLQALAKSGLAIGGKQVVIAGSGPLLLAVAKFMREHGARVVLIAEQADQASLVRFGMGLARYPAKLAQAVQLRAGLWGIPYLTSCWPVAASGTGKLESVTLRRGAKTWTVACDYLACGFGLIPNLELAALLGCRMSETGVAVNEYQETSVAGVYTAGETTGIGGLDLALAEGEIAGFAAAGKPDPARRRFVARAGYRRFAAGLERAFALRQELKELARPETIVCRCEDVPLARVRGCASWREAKLHARCGMGPCQGRVCGGAVEFLLGWKADSVRPPVFPARIESLKG